MSWCFNTHLSSFCSSNVSTCEQNIDKLVDPNVWILIHKTLHTHYTYAWLKMSITNLVSTATEHDELTSKLSVQIYRTLTNPSNISLSAFTLLVG